jgi:outer membrane protein insertion porin family
MLTVVNGIKLAIIWPLLAGWVLAGCNVTKHLDPTKGERLLVNNSIEFESDKPLSLSQKTSLNYELSGLVKQQPNRKALLLFYWRLHRYYRFKSKNLSSEQILSKKKWVEPPVIYDTLLSDRSARNLENYMRQKGYFNAYCTYKMDSVGAHKATAKYLLHLGTQYRVSSTQFTTRDSNLLPLLPNLQQTTTLKPGTPVANSLFDAEKLRITDELRNQGFAFFIPNYIEYTGDTTGTQTTVTIELLPPTDTSFHRVYYVDDVAVFSSLVPDVSAIRQQEAIDSIQYYSFTSKFFVKPKYLDKMISVRPGDLFRQKEVDQTNRKLSSLGVYRFVAVRPQADTLSPGKIDINTYFAPSELRSITFEPDVNYTTNDNILGNLLGISGNLNLVQRNLFHGAEILTNNIQYTAQFDLSDLDERDNRIYSSELRVGSDLTIPRFFDYFRFWRAGNKLGWKGQRLVSDRFYQYLKREAKAHFTATYSNIQLNDIYRLNSFNLSFGYNLNLLGQRTININHAGIELLDFVPEERFKEIADNNPLLARSLSNQLLTGFILRNFSYNLSTAPNLFGERYFFRLNAEASGLEVSLLNRLIAPQQTWRLTRNLNFARYLRLDVSGGYVRNFTQNWSAGLRMVAGVAVPFKLRRLDDAPTVPYIKQFFIGGPSSLRAWEIRQLGPGAFRQPLQADTLNNFYQAADFLWEFNAELRFPIFWWFKGAVFVDGGNIWSISTSQDIPASHKLNLNSYRNIALGSGVGIRFDFGYAVIRFDLGIKLRSPYPLNPTDMNDRYWYNWNRSSFREMRRFNLAIGYPF